MPSYIFCLTVAMAFLITTEVNNGDYFKKFPLPTYILKRLFEVRQGSHFIINIYNTVSTRNLFIRIVKFKNKLNIQI